MKNLIKSKKVIISVSAAFVVLTAMICSVIALNGTSIFSANAETTVSASDERVSLIAAASTEYSTAAAGTLIPFKVTRLVDGVESYLPSNAEISSRSPNQLRDPNNTSVVNFSIFEPGGESTVTVGATGAYYHHFTKNDRYALDMDHFELYYLKENSNEKTPDFLYYKHFHIFLREIYF